MKSYRKISALSLIGILFVSSIAVALPENPEGLVKRAVKKEVASEEVLPMTYAQVGATSEGAARLRFATPINVKEATDVTYTRSIDGMEDNVVEVKSVYKGIEADGTVYYYDGNNVTEEPVEGDYYWANYLIEFAAESSHKSTMITAKLDVDGKEAPFLTASYNAVASADKVTATFVDENGTLLGRSVVISGDVPVYAGEALEEGCCWSDGVNYYNEIPDISENITFSVYRKVALATPDFNFENGVLTPSANLGKWAYSINGAPYVETTSENVTLTNTGNLSISVIDVSDNLQDLNSAAAVKPYFVSGTLVEYEFDSINDGKVADLSGNGNDFVVTGNSTVTNSRLKLDNSANGALAYNGEALAYDRTSSITVEAVAKVDAIEVPASGDRWYPLVFKTGEYMIAYWTAAWEPGKARLCMALNAGDKTDFYFDDTNFWLPLDSIADGNFHHYAFSYDSVTGNVSYYLDNILLGSGNRGAGGVCHYTGNSIVLGGWGNKYDVTHNLIGFHTSATFDYFKVRNYAVAANGLTNVFAKTGYVVAEGNDLVYSPSNVSNLQYLTSSTYRPNYGSMSFEVSFAFNAADMTNGVRYTVANRGENFQLYLIKDGGNVFGQCYMRTTGTNNVYGQTFLDFGAINGYVNTFGDGTTVNTMKITFDAFTGMAYGQINNVYIDWCKKDFGGTLINPLPQILYVGSAAWGEAMPASTQFKSFRLTSDPTDIQIVPVA